MTDVELLQKYVEGRDQAAFGQLVGRHGNWLYGSARRQLGDEQLAEDVTQAVFLLLAQRGGGLKNYRYLSGWLFGALRYCVGHARRDRARQAKREKEAAAMRREEVGQEAGWQEIAPALDEALAGLGAKDRDAVLLRFYQGLSFSEVAAALGTGEEAAKKRTQRALEKLRAQLAKQGVTAAAAALGVLMVEKVTQAAALPAPALARLAEGAMAAGGGSSGAGAAAMISKGAMKMMAWAKVKVAALLVVGMASAAGGLALGLEERHNAATAPVAAVKELKGTLKNGVSAELLGVAQMSAGAKEWWRADGAPIASNPYRLPAGSWSHDSAGRVLAFRVLVKGPAGMTPELAEEEGLPFMTVPERAANGKPFPGVSTRLACLPVGIPVDTLRVQIWGEPWQTATVISPLEPGQPIGPATSTNVSIEPRGNFRLDQVSDTRGFASVRIDQPMQGADVVAARVVATGTDGKAYFPVVLSDSFSDGRAISTVIFPPLKQNEVKAVALQCRHYAGWVEFQNVSLKAGGKTDARVVTSDDAQGPREADARTIRPGDRLAVTIWDLTGPNEPAIFRVHVGEAGSIRLPWVGTISVAGLSATEMSGAINQVYREKELIRNAVVEIHFIDDSTEPAVVAGAFAEGDTLLLRIWGLERPNTETIKKLQVSKNGQVVPPLLGPVQVKGLPADVAADVIAHAYADVNVIRRAAVSVERLAGNR